MTGVLSCIALAGTLWYPAFSQQNQPSDPAKTKTINVTVTDREQHVVTGLKAADFTIYEDDRPQQVLAASLSDAPACLAIALDNSGSMRRIVSTVVAAISDFLTASNPENETFLVNFNNEAYMDQDFTKDRKLILAALQRTDARGGTALYDAAVASGDHLAKQSPCAKRILLLITDGEDNQSRVSLKQATTNLQRFGVTVYAVGLSGELGTYRHPLESLAFQTGGDVFFVHKPKETGDVFKKAAEQIRNQYTVTYAQDNTTGIAGKKITVKVAITGRKDLFAHVVLGNP